MFRNVSDVDLMQIYFDVRRTAWLNANTFPACEVILQNSSYSAMHSICNCVIISPDA